MVILVNARTIVSRARLSLSVRRCQSGVANWQDLVSQPSRTGAATATAKMANAATLADTNAPAESIERPLGPPAVQKLNGWELFEKMGRPKFVVAVSGGATHHLDV